MYPTQRKARANRLRGEDMSVNAGRRRPQPCACAASRHRAFCAEDAASGCAAGSAAEGGGAGCAAASEAARQQIEKAAGNRTAEIIA